MKTIFECTDMDAAGALHNAFLDYLVAPEGMEVKVGIIYDQSGNEGAPGGWITGWWVALEMIQIPSLDWQPVEKKKPHPRG